VDGFAGSDEAVSQVSAHSKFGMSVVSFICLDCLYFAIRAAESFHFTPKTAVI
jgi:hypothetical protein